MIRFDEIAKQARKDAEDYEILAKRHEERAAHYKKLSDQRIDDAEWYEEQYERKTFKEAAQ